MKYYLQILCLPLALTLFEPGKHHVHSDGEIKEKSKRMSILVSHTWVYDEYFRNYNSSNTILYYKRGKANPLLNLDPNRVTFFEDGTYTEITEFGTTLNGTWEFLNNEKGMRVYNSAGVFSSTIELLEDGRFYWYDNENSNGTYGKMLPEDCSHDNSPDILLVANK